MKKYFLTLLFATSTAFATPVNESWKKAVDELIREAESIDSNTKSHAEEWLKIKQNLQQAALQVESENGLKLSVQGILDHWRGLHLRVLDRQDAQFWALAGEEVSLPPAWFSLKGSRWHVRYAAPSSNLRRGDAIPSNTFSPFDEKWQKRNEWKLTLQGNPMKEAKPVSLPIQKQSLDAWSLDMSQKSGQVVVEGKKRLCFEKVWLFLSESVARTLDSKIKNSSCHALLVDLRDSFGEGLPAWSSPQKDLVIAVLINQQTREGASTLAKSLKSSGARIFGESSEGDRLPSAARKISALPWILTAGPPGESLAPDQEIKDSFIYAEGFDEMKETATAWLRKKLEL